MADPSHRGSDERAPRSGAGRSPVSAARRDLIAGAVTLAAVALLVSTFGKAAGEIVPHMLGHGSDDPMLATTLLLNVALILFGWRRYRDLTVAAGARDQAEARAVTLAASDALTGFLNRRSFAEAAAVLLADSQRRGKAMALLLIDLDQFRTVNDVHGAKAGDAVLREAAEAIGAAVPGSALTARLDGDEFAVALAFDPANPATVDAAADYLVEQLGRPMTADTATVRLTASIGIALSTPRETSIEALIRRAAIGLAQAKAHGGNRHAPFDASVEREMVARTAIESGIRDGVPRGEFVPYYEQQIDIASGRLTGFEVLARWNHPDGRLIAPETFIAIAEESGLIGELSMAVMREAFEEARSWDPSLTLSVNISPAQLKDAWLAQKIVRLLVETGFPAQRLEIEITESALINNLGLAQSIIGSLKNQGIRLALDDFGTGYSSLAHLRALPFDRIKIDRSFVTAINADAGSAAIVDAIARLGESLGLPVTAEGIEDEAIRARLQMLGCADGQGFHYGRPMPVTAARRLLAERGLLPSARTPEDPQSLSSDAA